MQFDEEGMLALQQEIMTGCDEYTAKYKELTSLIDAVQDGTFQGTIATIFQDVYNQNKKTFDTVTNDIETKGQTIKSKTQAGVALAEDLGAFVKQGY